MRIGGTSLGIIVAIALAGAAARFVVPAGAQSGPLVLTVQNHEFRPRELHGTAGESFVLRIQNMDVAPVEFSSPMLRVRALVSPKTSETIRVGALPPGRYTFVDLAHSHTRGTMILR